MTRNVKKFMLWMLAVLAWATPALALETNLMMHTDGEYLYIIKFVYDTNDYIHPPLMGPPHYTATITVSEVRSNSLTEVCAPWMGYYTARKCYEDDPVAVVRQALGRRWRRRAGSGVEQPLTQAMMRKFGFALRDNGKEWGWEREIGGVVVRFVQVPTLSRLFGEVFEAGAKKALKEQRRLIREALMLKED